MKTTLTALILALLFTSFTAFGLFSAGYIHKETIAKTGTILADGQAYECIPFVIEDYWQARVNK